MNRVGFPRLSQLSVACRVHRVAAICFLLVCATGSLGAKSPSGGKVLIGSDIHFNPMADASLVPELVRADPTKWESILQRSQPRQFSQYGQDTNWWLLRSSLDQMRKTMPRPALFLLPGDLLAHGFPTKFRNATHDTDVQHYREFVAKTVQFLALQVRLRWKDTQIVITPGNNDDDCQDYSILAGGAFLTDTAEVARELARGDEQVAVNWAALGSYSIQPSTMPGLKVIAVNTVFFSARYQAQDLQSSCAKVQSDGAERTFAWLGGELQKARQANQKVWLVFHIPPGVDGWASTHPSDGQVPPVGEECVKDIVPMWVPSWTAKFEGLLQSYSQTIIANLAGHVHVDNFLASDNAGTSGFVVVNPPISPIYRQNPAFRVLDFGTGFVARDYTTYYLADLTASAKQARGKWKKEYEFSKTWNAGVIDTDSLEKIYKRIVSDDSVRQRWLTLYNVSSEAAKVAPEIVPGLYCVIEGWSIEAYSKCACGTGK